MYRVSRTNQVYKTIPNICQQSKSCKIGSNIGGPVPWHGGFHGKRGILNGTQHLFLVRSNFWKESIDFVRCWRLDVIYFLHFYLSGRTVYWMYRVGKRREKNIPQTSFRGRRESNMLCEFSDYTLVSSQVSLLFFSESFFCRIKFSVICCSEKHSKMFGDRK